MFRVINEYMSKVNLKSDSEIYNRISEFLKDIPDIKKYTITVNFQHYVIDIRLSNYSVDKAAEVFNTINAGISYPYSSLYVRFNEGKCVRYRYLTSKENKDAIYCDIIFS